ncbi:hypothetical protein GALL_469320 [mine drainage metagenome]|uniref:Uncharacterized protein n=1 Tax=mine drainage metagenome TaxID=410659 RepID=A0A1J5Q1U4_9ZZZZ
MFRRIDRIGRHHPDPLTLAQLAIHYAHQHHHAHVVVEPRVDDHRPQGPIAVTFGRRHARDDRLQDVIHTQAGFGRTGNRVRGIDADNVFDLLLRALWVGLRQIHLVEHRNHLDAQVERGVAVGYRLRFDTLTRIDHQQGPLAGRERATHFVAEVDVPGCVDQIEVVDLTIASFVLQRSSLRLDRDATLALDIHRVENLRLHFTITEPPAALNQAISQGRLAVVDVSNDGEITNMVHVINRSARVLNSHHRSASLHVDAASDRCSRCLVETCRRQKKGTSNLWRAFQQKMYGNCFVGTSL